MISGLLEGTGVDARAEGLTGQFTKNAPIVCGGKNDQDTLNTCFEYHPDKNRFKIQKLLNVITMGQTKSDNNNRMIAITDDFTDTLCRCC